MRRWIWVVPIVIASLAVGYAVAAKAWGLPGVQLGAGRDKQVDTGLVCSLGQFITNLKDSGRYIRITLDLQAMDKQSQEELAARSSELKTDIYALLRSKHYEELVGEEGLRNLQKAVLERIENKCPGMVRAVFFTEFIIQ
ncbi:MAG: flagellar basal body-associated FliL family protein [Bacillota bacterium]|jgi:flagellar basal body-associated protein FliL|nr:flagellar basal body-associated FliL family protein [Candidatus Fermentithermobacillaceae bacterium]